MKPFGKAEREGAPTRSPALTPGASAPGRNESPAGQPALSASHEKPVMSASLRERIMELIEPSVAATVSREVLRRQIEEIIHSIANQERLELSGREQLQLADELADDMTGYGPLRPLLLDDTINDVMVNGPSNVYVERKGKLERVAVRFRDNDHIASVAQKIAGRVGRRVDESSPMVDCRLPDGSRVNIILPPLAIHSPCISIRKFPTHRYDIAGMIENGTMTPPIGRLLEIAARSRLNILVSGGTGSGKTTLLNALSQFIDHSERIVTIEDAAELQLQQPHVITLETRPPSLEGTGLVTQRDLLWNALRMRPDRIIVGEVRGLEVMEMLEAMSTGHDGSISTVHANNPRDSLGRLEIMMMLSGFALPERAMRQQIAAALNLVIHLSRMSDGSRKVLKVTEISGVEGETIMMQDLFEFARGGMSPEGKAIGSFRPTGIRSTYQGRLEASGIRLDPRWFAR
jgi:pilus assembly protein CpaF